MLDLGSRYSRGFTPRDRRAIDDWARANIKVGSWSPWEGDFTTDRTPQIVEPLRKLGLPGPRRVTLRGPAAGGKSTVGEVFLAWAIDNSPGFAVWYSQDEDAAKEFAETRVQRVLDSCEAVRKWFPSSRHQKRTQAINFPHMSFLIQAANEGNAQSKHIRHLIMDEPWMYEAGMMAQLRKRTTRYSHNRTILEMSTGSYAEDEFDQSWHQGSRQEWQIFCTSCERHHVPQWTFGKDVPGGVNWTKDAKRADGSYDMRAVEESTTYQCPHCHVSFAANSANAYALNSPGKYTEPALDAMPCHWSFHWNCICSDFAKLGESAVEYLQAKAAENRGTSALLQEFNQKKLAKAWSEEVAELTIGQRGIAYTLAEKWVGAETLFMGVDCQHTHFWVVVRAASRTGGSRMVACAKLETWESVRAFQISHSVNDDCVAADSGEGERTNDVYTACAMYGWYAIKGEKVPQGYRLKLKNGKTVFQIARGSVDMNGKIFKYRPTQLAPGSKQTYCKLILVSDEMSSEILAKARDGDVAGWTVPTDAPDFYKKQLGSMRRVQARKEKTNQPYTYWKEVGKAGNHLWDCERYLIALMFLGGFFFFTNPADESANPPPAK